MPRKTKNQKKSNKAKGIYKRKNSSKFSIKTTKTEIGNLANAIQVFSFGVLVWIGVALLGLVDVLFYYFAFIALVFGLAPWFFAISNKWKNILWKYSILLSIGTGLIGLSIYGILSLTG